MCAVSLVTSLPSPSLSEHNKKIDLFHDLHNASESKTFVIPNAWDALSAKQMELSGAPAIATTSLGMAATFGYQDGERLPFEKFILMIECMARVISVPLSVDFESGYGKTDDQICSNVKKLIELGVVGINIEDADPENPGTLFEQSLQRSKIESIKKLALDLGCPKFFVNARTDIYWQREAIVFNSEKERFEKLIEIAKLFKEAGADGVFVPGLTDLSLINKLAKEVDLPINVQKGNWSSLEEAKLNGVSRISTGSSLFRLSAETTKVSSSSIQESPESILRMKPSSISYADINNYFEKKA